MKYSSSDTTFLAYCTFARVAANPISGTKEQQARLFTVSLSPPPPADTWPSVNQGRRVFLVRRPRSNHVFSLPFLFNCLAYHYMNFAVIMANVGKRKAFSIGAEKHGENAFSQNEIEHFECCDYDVITSGEVSEEGIVALVNEEKNSIVDSSSDIEEEQDEPWLSIADAKTFWTIFFATENIDEHVVNLFKIEDKKIDELYIKLETLQPKIASFFNVVD
ncbi:hypothetical protein AVEN_218781-1 [Araneus ventricosus]|uniref:Uncharacterized protein n=1 Tax=Araneus ventricosus TaxID=182803 RepID=A0A4Y2B6K7_ARAVE|nr:hypothetical protein AVEN_218781-1 [Araneus ventricosus]